MPLLSIVGALDALETGDQALACAILLGALETSEDVYDLDGRRKPCPHCAAGPMWPGLLEHHFRAVHPDLVSVAA